MKIQEILNESEETIQTYLIIYGFDLSWFIKTSASAITQYERNPNHLMKEALRSALFELDMRLMNIINSDVWERFGADPDVDQVYTKFTDLIEANQQYLKGLK